jgi:aminomuconate-semialdehyde/2-hydroxymuconate-6-semialdehyde dehydrogenase
VVACISPWNLPLYLLTWKIAPALAAGNTVVAKPSELTPLTAYLLGKLCGEAGVPPGVVNLVHGTGLRAGEPLITDPRTPVISFTGGTVTGARIAGLAAPLFKKMSLELGGKNPNIVFADADLDQAVETAVRAGFTNQGEICLCGSRILIQQPIYNTFREKFLAKVQALTVGDPREQVNLGALVSEGHLHKVLGYVQLARDEGGTVLCGGNRLHPDGSCRDGFFMEPTVIEGLDNTCRTNQEEIFGPVVTLQPFEDEGEALALANGTPFGLAAQVWTSDLSRAHRVAQQLKFGLVWVNCWMIRDLRTPFGGAKASGIGREGGVESLRFFTEPTNVCIKV